MRRHASVLHWYTWKVVFRQLPHVTDSFNVLSVHCVTSGSGASFLQYKCPTSRGGSLRQHGLLVSFLAIRTFRTLLLMTLSLMTVSNGRPTPTILLYAYVIEFSKGWFRRKLWDLVCLECREENRAFSGSSIRLRPNLVLIRPWTTPHNSPARTLVFRRRRSRQNSKGFTPTEAPNAGKYVKICDFQQITRKNRPSQALST